MNPKQNNATKKTMEVTMSNNKPGTWIRGVTGPIFVEIGITTQGLIYIK